MKKSYLFGPPDAVMLFEENRGEYYKGEFAVKSMLQQSKEWNFDGFFTSNIGAIIMLVGGFMKIWPIIFFGVVVWGIGFRMMRFCNALGKKIDKVLSDAEKKLNNEIAISQKA